MKKSIVLNILDFNLITENNKFHNVFVIKERDENFTLIEDLEIHYVELNKFNEYKDISKLNDLEEWIIFLKECTPNGDVKIIEELSKKKEEIGKAMAIMEKLSADEIEYQRYLAREKYIMDEISKKKYAEHKIKMAEESLKITEEKLNITKDKLNITEDKLNITEDKLNITEDRLKMAEEAKKRIEEEKKKLIKLAIKNLLQNGNSEETISQILGISVQEVKSNM